MGEPSTKLQAFKAKMFLLLLASLLCSRQTSTFEIGSIVFINVSKAKISTKQYPKAGELAAHFDGKYAKVIGQTINSRNHSKWIIESLHNASIKLKIRGQHLTTSGRSRGSIEFHYFSGHFTFEEFSMWRQLRPNKRNMFLVLDTFTAGGYRTQQIMPTEFLQYTLASSFSTDLQNSSCLSSAKEMNTFLKLFYLSPQWMESVLRTMRFQLRSSVLQKYASLLQVIDTFKSVHTLYHRVLAVASIRMHRLALHYSHITESEYCRLMKEPETGIAKAELDQRNFYLDLPVPVRKALVTLFLHGIYTKTSIFAKVHKLAGKEWTSNNEEIAAKYEENIGCFDTFHVIAHSPIDQTDWAASAHKIRKWLFG